MLPLDPLRVMINDARLRQLVQLSAAVADWETAAKI